MFPRREVASKPRRYEFGADYEPQQWTEAIRCGRPDEVQTGF
jgi:hypothetical protein